VLSASATEASAPEASAPEVDVVSLSGSVLAVDTGPGKLAAVDPVVSGASSVRLR
jgi:hypothetical protein